MISVVECAGQNKVIGNINENPIFSQFTGKKHGHSSFSKPSSFCPFRYYKDMKTRYKSNSGDKDKEKEKEFQGSQTKTKTNFDHASCQSVYTQSTPSGNPNSYSYSYSSNQIHVASSPNSNSDKPKTKPESSFPLSLPPSTTQSHPSTCTNNIIRMFMHRLDPMLSLCTKETEDKKVKQMLLDLSLNLSSGKQFFRKMGFSRRRNISVNDMERELTASHHSKDEHLSLEVLQYLCNLCEIDAILIDLDNTTRAFINGYREKEDHDHLIILCESRGNRRIKTVVGEFHGNRDANKKDVNRFIMSALINTRYFKSDYLDSMKLHEIKQIYKLLTEDDSKNKGWKKDSYVDFILGLKLKWERNEER